MRRPALALACLALLVLLPACNCDGGQGPGDGGGGGGGAAGGGGGGQAVACGWERTLPFESTTQSIEDLLPLADGTTIGVGYTAGNAVPQDPASGKGGWVFRLSREGELLWSRGYGGVVTLTRAMLDSSGDLVVVGTSASDAGCANHHGLSDVYFTKLRVSDGEPLVRTCIGGEDDESPSALREVQLPAGRAYQITGATDSHSFGDVGPKHGGSAFEATDLMNAVYLEAPGGPVVTVSCHGSNGPESGAGFLQDGGLVGNTFGDNGGDFAGLGNPEPAFSDLMQVTFANPGVCAEKSCPAEARRFGGSGNDGVNGVLPGDLAYGSTASSDGGLACPGASQADLQLWLARWTDRPQGVRCVQGAISGQPTDAFLHQGTAWVLVPDPASGGEYQDPEVVGADAGTLARSMALAFDPSLALVRKVRARGERLSALAVREDGCLVLAGRGLNLRGVRVLTVPPP